MFFTDSKLLADYLREPNSDSPPEWRCASSLYHIQRKIAELKVYVQFVPREQNLQSHFLASLAYGYNSECSTSANFR